MSRKLSGKASVRSSSRKVRIMQWSRPETCFRIVVAQPVSSRKLAVPGRFKTRGAALARAKKARLVVA